VAAVAMILAVALAGCSPSASNTGETGSTATTSSTTAAPSTTTASPASTTSTTLPPSRRTNDGSLGNWASRAACRLLDRQEIAKVFGGPVTSGVPTFPDCEWLVGATAFLALDFEPRVPFAQAAHWAGALVRLKGLGNHAEIADNRYLYFSDHAGTFWLLWQQVGDFTSLHETQLVALARDVLAHPLPPAKLPPTPLGPPGPPIYFAGDSTAAGPEWAYVTYHTGLGRLKTLAEYQVGSGLVVPAYFDWPRHLLAVTAVERPRLVIYMGSGNDDQDLPDGAGYAAVGSPAWRKAYGARVGATMSALTREGAKVLWIGEPAMQSPALSEAMLALDEVCQQEATTHPGVTFFNPGTVLNRPGWRYSPTAVVDGRRVAVRLDGVHLNTAGSALLATFIAPIVKRILGIG